MSQGNVQTLRDGDQIIKTRDDIHPIVLTPAEPEEGNSSQGASQGQDSQETVNQEVRFKIKEPQKANASWAKSDGQIGPEKLRERIEPWLTALCQSEHLSLLVGSGLTHAVHTLATGRPGPGMCPLNLKTLKVLVDRDVTAVALKAGRGEGNFEDQVRVINELIRGLEILTRLKNVCSEQLILVKKQPSGEAEELLDVESVLNELTKELSEALQSFANSILKAENNLTAANNANRERALNYLVSFLLTFATRAGTRDRLNLFTTNYDRFIELGADVAGLRLLDRFIGTIAPLFRASRLDVDLHYNPPGIRGEPRYLEGVVRFTKLHGSLDWVYCEGEIRRIGLPFGAEDIEPFLKAPGLEGISPLQLIIYPNSAKDMETLFYPYSELFRDFAAAICRPNSTLVSYGYSFGDEHINRIVADMLTIPSAHLVIISYSDPLGRIMQFYEKLGRPAQMTLLLGNHLGDLKSLVDHYLPKPAIDRSMIRMAELIRARLGEATS